MIGAVVLAAGRSQRMGRPKMVLPWGEITVIGQVVDVLTSSGVDDIVVVAGEERNKIKSVLKGLPVRIVYNPDFANGEMTRTLQIGINALRDTVEAALVVLGDQPQIEKAVVEKVLAAYQRETYLVVPSYQMRRGHPWLVGRTSWNELLELQPPDTLREFLNRHTADICYVEVATPSVI